MKILLLSPINRSYVIMPSLGLGYLASCLLKDGHAVSVLNCIKEQLTYDQFREYIQREDFDLIGFQVYSYDLNSVKKHLAIVRECSPRSVTIAGGAHPSGDPLATLTYLEQLNFVFHGEAEIGLPMLVSRLEAGSREFADIPGLGWRSAPGGISINPQEAVQELDSLPIPAWSLLRPEDYPEAPHGAFTKNFPTAPIIITRGCPSKCTFCAGHTINGRAVRRRSVANVMTELRLLASRGIREFHIEDENFTASNDFVLEFCRCLQSERLGLSWSLPSGIRLDTLNRETLLTMAKAGCYSLALGIEFGSDRILKKTGKGLSVEKIRQQVNLTVATGIKITGFFIFGIPGETQAEMEQTLQLALELPLDRAQFNLFMPLPGSVEWDTLKQQKRLDNINWDRFFVHDVAYAENVATASYLKKLHRHAVLRFYLRPRIIFGLLGEIRSPRHVFYLVKRLIDTLK